MSYLVYMNIQGMFQHYEFLSKCGLDLEKGTLMGKPIEKNDMSALESAIIESQQGLDKGDIRPLAYFTQLMETITKKYGVTGQFENHLSSCDMQKGVKALFDELSSRDDLRKKFPEIEKYAKRNQSQTAYSAAAKSRTALKTR